MFRHHSLMDVRSSGRHFLMQILSSVSIFFGWRQFRPLPSSEDSAGRGSVFVSSGISLKRRSGTPILLECVHHWHARRTIRWYPLWPNIRFPFNPFPAKNRIHNMDVRMSWFRTCDILMVLTFPIDCWFRWWGDWITFDLNTQHELLNERSFLCPEISLRILTSECVADHERTSKYQTYIIYGIVSEAENSSYIK